MRYPGGKFRCYQKLVNLIPPHRVYIETHLGGGAVMRNKAPAEFNIGIDRDSSVIREFRSQFTGPFIFLNQAAEEFLENHRFSGDEFVYADPPYFPSTRRSKKSAYRYDYTEADHVRLLNILRKLPCPAMVSGYQSKTYDNILQGWDKIAFWGTSHIGRRKEIVWLNFRPGLVHDTRYLGHSFRERQCVRRMRARWTRRFLQHPLSIQQALLVDLRDAFRQSQEQALNI